MIKLLIIYSLDIINDWPLKARSFLAPEARVCTCVPLFIKEGRVGEISDYITITIGIGFD